MQQAPVEDPASIVAGWSNEQQKQLETGMRDFPGSIPVKERWVKIAEKVEGKTAKECYERFKEICSLLKKQQDASQTTSS
jgi:DnaJ family protein C protein 2